MQPADEMKQPAVPVNDRSVNKPKQLCLDFLLEIVCFIQLRTLLGHN